MIVDVFVGIVCAAFFFRAADYEQMSPWIWSAASVAISGVAIDQGSGVPMVLLLQAALFGGMWWYNMRRKRQPGTRGGKVSH